MTGTEKVLFVTSQFRQGGAERYLYELCRSLKRRGWEIGVLTRTRGVKDQHYYGLMRHLGLRIYHRIPTLHFAQRLPWVYASAAGRRACDAINRLKLRASLRGLLQDYDLICFIQIENYLLLQAGIADDRPCVIHLLSNTFQYDHDVYAALRRDRSYRFVMTDPAQREEVGDKLGANAEFAYVPFGMDFTAMRNVYEPRRPSFPRIGVFMRLSSQRPLEPLFYCFHSLVRHLDASLYVYGDGNPRQFERTLRLLKLQDRVRFRGHVRNIEEAVSSDALSMAWMTSHNGILGYASLELAGLGVPLITWNLGTRTYEQVLSETGGALHAFQDVVAFVEFCRAALEDAAALERLSVALRNHVLRTHDIETVVPALERFYRAAIRGAPRARSGPARDGDQAQA